ncbi:hypothetical protein C8Q74DRAFT_374710 [Fomes fomentarius]|nr:hypothetical protein C8Q74DRAFT_374710 [Fomes fomentarius]
MASAITILWQNITERLTKEQQQNSLVRDAPPLIVGLRVALAGVVPPHSQLDLFGTIITLLFNHQVRMTRALPLELMYLVLDALGDDHRTLRRCAQTGHLLLPYIRTRLFRTTTLNSGPTTRRFFQVVKANPALGHLIERLTISSLETTHNKIIYPRIELTPGLLPFHNFPNLRSLTLIQVHLESLFFAFDALTLLWGLQELYLEHTDFQSGNRHAWEFYAYEMDTIRRGNDERTGRLTKTFPALKTLSVKHSHTADVSRIVQTLLLHKMSLRIETLELELGDESQCLAWTPFIEEVGWKLQNLSIRIQEECDGISAWYSKLLTAISSAPLLRKLVLGFRPDWRLDSTPQPYVLNSLCTALERRFAPFQRLETLRLEFVEREGHMIHADEMLFSRLAHSLLATSTIDCGPALQIVKRYPSFRQLEVGVRVQERMKESLDTNVMGGFWSDRNMIEADEEDDILGRWRKGLQPFQEAQGIVLGIFLIQVE